MKMSEPVESFVAKRHAKRYIEEGDDCQSCRLLNGSLIVGAGIFVGIQAYRQKNNTKTEQYMKIAMSGVGLGISGLGVARIFALPPFRSDS